MRSTITFYFVFYVALVVTSPGLGNRKIITKTYSELGFIGTSVRTTHTSYAFYKCMRLYYLFYDKELACHEVINYQVCKQTA